MRLARSGMGGDLGFGDVVFGAVAIAAADFVAHDFHIGALDVADGMEKAGAVEDAFLELLEI